MRTEKQREASRINGSKSRGPKTTEGKAISSMNAVRRDLLSKTLLIRYESDAHFQAQLQQLLDEFQPLPGYETSLVEIMAIWRWRELRILGLETAAVTHEMRNQEEMSQEPFNAPTYAVFAIRNLTDHSRVLPYFAGELTRCEVQYMRAYRALMQARSRRPTTFHPVEPGVPPPRPRDPAQNNDLSEDPSAGNEPKTNPPNPETQAPEMKAAEPSDPLASPHHGSSRCRPPVLSGS